MAKKDLENKYFTDRQQIISWNLNYNTCELTYET